jgi:hypothetical protein
MDKASDSPDELDAGVVLVPPLLPPQAARDAARATARTAGSSLFTDRDFPARDNMRMAS